MKDDDFFEKYVDKDSTQTGKRKGSVKKNLFNSVAPKSEPIKKAPVVENKPKVEKTTVVSEEKETRTRTTGVKKSIVTNEQTDITKATPAKQTVKAEEIKEETKKAKMPKTTEKTTSSRTAKPAKEPVISATVLEEKVETNEKPKVTRSKKTTKVVDIPVEKVDDEIVEEVKEIKATRRSTRKTEMVEDTTEEPVEMVEDTQYSEETTTMQNAENTETKHRSRKKDKREMTLEDYNVDYVTKSLSQTIHESMIPYSEFVILDRALPRVEDGLKPVQRRVLYSMLEIGVLPDRPFKKSASIVGECMGKYHPHGDTSIYDTLVRMAQPFNMCEPLVDGHGNFGSVDGDTAAAMRYTEAKLTPLALELLRDLEKDTVPWQLNFDDRLKEPVILPGRFPNLLVNGCQGIAVGLATNIPTHNFTEACNAVIAYIDKRSITVDELMKIMPAPDFPSGGYILNSSEIKQMYETGKGKIYIRSKIHIENGDNGKKNIVITEIPFQVNKAAMLQKIAKYRDANPDGPMGGIQEIVDESDRFGTRAVIKLKKEAKINSILNLLYKYCDVQTTFGANIVAIADGKPKQMGLREILEYYVNFQQKVIYNRTNYDLEEALKKEHILEGLLIAIRNIDEVVRIIKTSKNVTDAKITLMQTFELTEIQAQAILDMRLARLTSLEVNKLITDLNRLRDLIKRYTAILKSPTLQMKVVKSELQELIKSYGKPRKTKFLNAEEHFEDSSIVIDMDTDEDIETFHFIATPAGTIKTINLKSYKLVSKELSANATLSEVPSISFKVDNNKDVYVFTNIGNSIKIPVDSINECKFRDKGTSLFTMAKNTTKDEKIVSAVELDQTLADSGLIFVTKSGMMKVSKISDYLTTKQVVSAIKLAKNDEVVLVDVFNPNKKLTLFTALGNAVKVDVSDLNMLGRTSIGVKAIALEKTDYVVGAYQTSISDAFALFTNDGYAKIIKQSDIEESVRNRKGLSYLSPKAKNSRLVYASRLSAKNNYVIMDKNEKLHFVLTTAIPIDTRTGLGKAIVKDKVTFVYPYVVS